MSKRGSMPRISNWSNTRGLQDRFLRKDALVMADESGE